MMCHPKLNRIPKPKPLGLHPGIEDGNLGTLFHGDGKPKVSGFTPLSLHLASGFFSLLLRFEKSANSLFVDEPNIEAPRDSSIWVLKRGNFHPKTIAKNCHVFTPFWQFSRTLADFDGNFGNGSEQKKSLFSGKEKPANALLERLCGRLAGVAASLGLEPRQADPEAILYFCG
jgi:hypothetical protein